VSKVATGNPCSDTKLINYLLQLLLEPGRGIIGEISVIVEAVGAIEKVVEEVRIRLESETLTFWAFIVQLIRDARNVIRELSLLPDGMIVPHLDKVVDLAPKDGHKDEKKDCRIRGLARNKEPIRFEIAKIGNPPL
jgi:hypothetical protein